MGFAERAERNRFLFYVTWLHNLTPSGFPLGRLGAGVRLWQIRVLIEFQ